MCGSDVWFAEAAEAVEGITGDKAGGRGRDVSAVLSYTVNGTPQGRVRCHMVVEEGEVISLAPGPASADPDIAVTLDYADAVAIVTGALAAEVAYMSGAMRLEGRHALWLTDLRELRAAVITAVGALPN